MIQMLPLITHFQVKIPEKLRGKVMGVINATTMVSAPLGMWLIGGIMSVFAWEYIILGTGGLLILLALFFSRNRSFMAFTEDLKI